jgi:hypothetical protein
MVSANNAKTETFTVTNSNTATGTSYALQLPAATSLNAGFTLSNDLTSGHKLAPGQSSTFDLTFTAPASCPTPKLFATPLLVTSTPPTGTTASPYISVINSANCGPPITAVTATLLNLTSTQVGNPAPVSSSVTSQVLQGTVKNVSVTLPPPPPPTCGTPSTGVCGRLHGFTIQIPFSLTAGTLNCDANRFSNSIGTCSVSNNVLTVTQKFPFPFYLPWVVGHSQQVGYSDVGSQGPAFVAFGAPIVTAFT